MMTALRLCWRRLARLASVSMRCTPVRRGCLECIRRGAPGNCLDRCRTRAHTPPFTLTRGNPMTRRPHRVALSLLAATLTSAPLAGGAAELDDDAELRLIQTGPHHRAWMTPAQVFELSRRAHDA